MLVALLLDSFWLAALDLSRRGRFHCRAHIFDRRVRVKFRSDRDIGMAEDLLHDTQIAGLAQGAHAGRMAQVVNARVDAGLFPFPLVRSD